MGRAVHQLEIYIWGEYSNIPSRNYTLVNKNLLVESCFLSLKLILSCECSRESYGFVESPFPFQGLEGLQALDLQYPTLDASSSSSDPLMSLRQSFEDIASQPFSASAFDQGSSTSSLNLSSNMRRFARPRSKKPMSIPKDIAALCFPSQKIGDSSALPGKKMHQCPHCPYQSQKRQHLEYHIRKHTGEKPYGCPHCSYRAAHESNMRRHIVVHHR